MEEATPRFELKFTYVHIRVSLIVCMTSCDAVVAGLEASDHRIRKQSLRALARLTPDALAAHAGAIVARIDHSEESTGVCALLSALALLEPTALSAHAGVLAARLEDSEEETVKVCALEALARLAPVALEAHADAFVERLADSRETVRLAALSALVLLEPAALSQHASAVVARLADSNGRCREKALAALEKIDPLARWAHAGAVVALLEHSEMDVRCAALRALTLLEPQALSAHAGAVVAKLEDSQPRVRDKAVVALAKLDPAALSARARAIRARLEHSEMDVAWQRSKRQSFARCVVVGIFRWVLREESKNGVGLFHCFGESLRRPVLSSKDFVGTYISDRPQIGSWKKTYVPYIVSSRCKRKKCLSCRRRVRCVAPRCARSLCWSRRLCWRTRTQSSRGSKIRTGESERKLWLRWPSSTPARSRRTPTPSSPCSPTPTAP